MSSKNKVTWITCPDCGSKIGIVLSVGKATTVVHEEEEQTEEWPPTLDVSTKLQQAGVDISQLEIIQEETGTVISPVKFLGDMWGQVNDAVRGMGGSWVRDGRNSHWEIPIKEP